MSFLNRIFKKKEQKVANEISEYMEMLNGYVPSFTSNSGGIYETDMIRSAIHAKAKHSAKLKPQIIGKAYKNFEKTLQTKPNPYQTTYDFLYRLRTMYEVDTYAFIIPLYNKDYSKITGLYPLKASQVELMELGGKIWLRYTFHNGKKAAIEYDRVGVISKYSYRNEFLGDGNSVLGTTMDLLNLQNQGIAEGIKQGATIRFIGTLGQTLRPEDLEKEKKRFSKANLSSENTSGIMLVDAKYNDVKQVDSKPFIIDDKQMSFIKNNVHSYFGVNDEILQNKYSEDTWSAFYEGEIETFGLQVSLAITNMLFSQNEIAFDNQVIFTSNRLQYASNETKIQVSTQLFDRGIFGADDVAEIWNMPITGDNKKYIRKEYAEIGRLEDPLDVVQVDKKDEVIDDDNN